MNRFANLGIVTLLSVVLGLLVHACGEEKNPCQKLRGIQMGMCDDQERDCLPCACLSKGKDYEVVFKPPPFQPQIDIDRSGCVEPGPCEGNALEHAQSCLDQENYCDPCFHTALEINVCDPNVFTDFCTGDW
jgi:hypothetical protein